MGTNYYLKRIPTEEDIEKMHSLVAEKNLQTLQEMVKEINTEIHICKCSCGWQTCFDHNWGVYWKPNRKSLEEWLSKPNYYIEDEYGEKISPDEFWKMVDERNANPKNSWTSSSYRKFETEMGKYTSFLCREDITKCERIFNIPYIKDNDFEVDALRFAVYSDFC